jgi:NAD(P)-dependent dehydrogenase (short-subunit alcohol dehydrogenase family)
MGFGRDPSQCPGAHGRLTPSRQETLKGEVLQRILSRIPLGRLVTPEDLIGAAIYLSSAASDFVTGQTLFVDGGWVAGS